MRHPPHLPPQSVDTNSLKSAWRVRLLAYAAIIDILALGRYKAAPAFPLSCAALSHCTALQLYCAPTGAW